MTSGQGGCGQITTEDGAVVALARALAYLKTIPLAHLPPLMLCMCVCVSLPAYVSGTRLHFLVKILSKIPAKSLRSSGKYARLGGSGRAWGLRPLLGAVIHGSGRRLSMLFHGEPGTHCLGIPRHFLEGAYVGIHTHASSNLWW